MSEPKSLPSELLPADIEGARNVGERIGTLFAWIGLLTIDLLLRIAGFSRFYKAMRACPTLGKPPGNPETARRICTAVDRAATYYYKRAWCLQRSATTVCLLRARGLAAELVIGARKMPFTAHAWVELDGEILNNSAIVKDRYTVLERC